MAGSYPEELVEWVLSREMSLRARRAVEHIVEHGYITTADLNEMGYDHPPRAIADVKDAGVGIVMSMVTIDGRRMARYELAQEIGDDSMLGRRQMPKSFRDALYLQHDYRCAVCGGRFTSRELQADHRIPYRIAGEAREFLTQDFMPLCPSCNRAKSWTCENCFNWEQRSPDACAACLWASPQAYSHVAGTPERRLDVTWTGDEVAAYDRLANRAARHGRSVQEQAKHDLS